MPKEIAMRTMQAQQMILLTLALPFLNI